MVPQQSVLLVVFVSFLGISITLVCSVVGVVIFCDVCVGVLIFCVVDAIVCVFVSDIMNPNPKLNITLPVRKIHKTTRNCFIKLL